MGVVTSRAVVNCTGLRTQCQSPMQMGSVQGGERHARVGAVGVEGPASQLLVGVLSVGGGGMPVVGLISHRAHESHSMSSVGALRVKTSSIAALAVHMSASRIVQRVGYITEVSISCAVAKRAGVGDAMQPHWAGAEGKSGGQIRGRMCISRTCSTFIINAQRLL